MGHIADNIFSFLDQIPSNVKLVAVSKTKSNEDIMEAYGAGQRIFGENKVQELVTKAASLPEDIQWHYIGHLQSNKVKYIAPFVSLIHAVDSFKLLKEINKQAKKFNRIIQVLLQFHIADEDTKFGLDGGEANELLQNPNLASLENIKIVGVMGMATYTDDQEQIKTEFTRLKSYFDLLKKEYYAQDEDFKELSMGMSGDYQLAIEQGSTMIRVGSSIFGLRSCQI